LTDDQKPFILRDIIIKSAGKVGQSATGNAICHVLPTIYVQNGNYLLIAHTTAFQAAQEEAKSGHN